MGGKGQGAGRVNNTSLVRLTVSSCGLRTEGAKAILSALTSHPRLIALTIGQSWATEDLGMRFNFIEDGAKESIIIFISQTPTLRLFELGTTSMSSSSLEVIATAVSMSRSLVVFKAASIHNKRHPLTKALVKATLQANVTRLYRLTMEQFDANEKRWLISPKDVRFIDSGYRNRDAGLARRKLTTLKKWWEDGMETVQKVVHANDESIGEEDGFALT